MTVGVHGYTIQFNVPDVLPTRDYCAPAIIHLISFPVHRSTRVCHGMGGIYLAKTGSSSINTPYCLLLCYLSYSSWRAKVALGYDMLKHAVAHSVWFREESYNTTWRITETKKPITYCSTCFAPTLISVLISTNSY
jgi:hypothetical protein